MQQIIVYRNPIEAAFYDSFYQNFPFFIVFSIVATSIFILLAKLAEKLKQDRKKPVLYVIFAISVTIAFFTAAHFTL